MKVRVLRSALEDIAVGRQFYDRQGSGIGEYFLDSIFTEIDSLVLFGGIHREVYGHHRLLAKRFPYAIYYQMIAGDIVVFRVLDCRRDPKQIRRELEEMR